MSYIIIVLSFIVKYYVVLIVVLSGETTFHMAGQENPFPPVPGRSVIPLCIDVPARAGEYFSSASACA